jgi:phosphotransferase system HPr (HPr) family protein
VQSERTVTIVNSEGLHARPSGAVVAVALDFESEIQIRCRDRKVNGRSILELITLGATCGSELHLSANGPDADELIEALSTLIGAGFSERP